MTRLVTVGYGAAAFVEQGHPHLAFEAALAREDLARLVDCTQAAAAADEDVLVVYPEWSAEPTLQRIATVRSTTGTDTLIAYASALPPLAGGVLASLAASLAQGAPSAGAVLSILPRLERRLTTVTWLRRLSSLQEPPPTLVQHAQSLLPWTCFAVTSWPKPAVLRVTDQTSVPLPTPRRAISVAIASSDGDVDWLREAVVRQGTRPAVREVGPSPLVAQWWGTGPVTELVLYPLDVVAEAADIARHLTMRSCHWCGRQVASAPCPHCGAAPAAAQGASVV